jgi:hypothetical protein
MSKKDKIEIPDQVGNENRGELDSKVVCANFAHTTPHGAIKGKMQISEVVLYNLDVIISVGYRVKSIAGTRFRQWANHVLKDYMLKGYAVNQRKIATDLQIADRLHEQRQLIESQGTEIAELKNATEKRLGGNSQGLTVTRVSACSNLPCQLKRISPTKSIYFPNPSLVF